MRLSLSVPSIKSTKQVVCGQCHSYSNHLFERLGSELGPWDGMTMKQEFCDALVSACGTQIDFGGPGEYDGLTYCEKHVGDVDGWSYPYTDREYKVHAAAANDCPRT